MCFCWNTRELSSFSSWSNEIAVKHNCSTDSIIQLSQRFIFSTPFTSFSSLFLHCQCCISSRSAWSVPFNTPTIDISPILPLRTIVFSLWLFIDIACLLSRSALSQRVREHFVVHSLFSTRQSILPISPAPSFENRAPYFKGKSRGARRKGVHSPHFAHSLAVNDDVDRKGWRGWSFPSEKEDEGGRL